MPRIKYGRTWWGKAWLEALSNIDYSNRLSRGRYYANNGSVIKVEIEDGLVWARVRGRRTVPYKITIRLLPFSSDDITKLTGVIKEDQLLAAEVAVGRLPESLPALLDDMGVELFPRDWQQVQSACSCPDWADPCKHVAALMYMLANEIDKDPFILFEMRGLPREALLTAADSGSNDLQSDPFIPLSDFQWQSPETVDFSLSELAARENEAEALFALLSENPLFCSKVNYKDILFQAYLDLADYVDTLTVSEKANLHNHMAIRFLWDDSKFAHPLEQVEVFLFDAGPAQLAGDSARKSVPVATEGQLQSAERIGTAISLKYLLWLFLDSPLILSGSWDVIFLSAAASVALVLIEKSLFVPEVVTGTNGCFYIHYRPRTEDSQVSEIIDILTTMLPAGLLSRKRDQAVMTGKQAVEAVLAMYLACLVQDVHELPAWDKLSWVFFGTDIYIPQTFEERQTGKAVADWLAPLSAAAGRFIPLLRVEVPVGRQKKFRIYFDVQDKEKSLSALVPLEDLYEKDHVFGLPAPDVLKQVAKLVALAGDYSPELKKLLAGKGKPLLLGGMDLARFLSGEKNILSLLGIQVLLPKELQSVVASKLILSANTKSRVVSYLSLDEILNFSWEVALDDLRLSKEEFEQLADGAEGVVRYRDRYLLLDPVEVQRLLSSLHKPIPKISGVQVLRAALTGEAEEAVFETDQPLQQLIADLHTIKDVAEPTGLTAELRPYQKRGFRWLYGNWEKGLGSCLADDMGLGKTIQVIALILKMKEEKQLHMPALVVCPTTLLGNWEKECARFAPGLSVSVCHGPQRKLQTEDMDIILTTYGVVRNDSEVFARLRFGLLVIDEAQNIKNADSRQAQALKELQADGYVAMSGTPVENRLDELWSVFDFLLPGYLGSRRHFSRVFAVPVEKYRDRSRAAVLRKATAPFILRRMKTDKAVITDLPDKIVKQEFCRLTADQTALYKKVLQQEMEQITGSGGMARRGKILRLMTWLKQICNHPAHFSYSGQTRSVYSGKAEMAMSLIRQFIAEGEKALIFTQYRKMGELLVKMIESETGLAVSFFHGGLQRKARQHLVDSFQKQEGCPLLIVSLKAGGTGLNLTEASHVLHYDLWWNPAVEEQATDRAYRIGQEKNVTVHRLITLGTLEEKIDAMLTAKKELADMTISAGETWLTEMSDDELKEIFSFQEL